MQHNMRNLSIFILGTTAVGKTKLSLQICKNFNGQIISCDSKQLYKHANLMTAKSTPQQLQICKHHMINCLELEENSYNRNKFFDHIKLQTRKIWKLGKNSIFIGGTNYYIEPALFNVEDLGKIEQQTNQLSSASDNQAKEEQTNPKKDLSWIKKLTKQQKYLKLKQVDPVMAEKLYKNDEVRITSFLQQFYKNDKKPSENYKPYTTELNNLNTILFWVRNSDRSEHRMVVESRIKQMLGKDGIIQILSVFTYLDVYYFDQQYEDKIKISEEKMIEFEGYLKKRLTAAGIGQSIGYKEFFQLYFEFRTNLLHKFNQDQAFRQMVALFQPKKLKFQEIYEVYEKNYNAISKSLLITSTFEKASEQLVRNTLAYCKRQLTWIRNRIFIKDPTLIQRFYILDLAADEQENCQNLEAIQVGKQAYDKKDLMSRFETKAKSRAVQIIEQVQKNGFKSAYQKFQLNEDEFKEFKQETKLQNWKKYICQECEIELNGFNEWQQHLKSKKHQKRLKYQEKKTEYQKWILYRKEKQAQTLQRLQFKQKLLQQQQLQQKISQQKQS